MDNFEKTKLIFLGIGIVLMVLVLLLIAKEINSAVDIIDSTSDQLLSSMNY